MKWLLLLTLLDGNERPIESMYMGDFGSMRACGKAAAELALQVMATRKDVIQITPKCVELER